MKRFLIIFGYVICIIVIIYLFESIMSGTFCHCGKVYCPSTLEQQLRSKIT